MKDCGKVGVIGGFDFMETEDFWVIGVVVVGAITLLAFTISWIRDLYK